uniref:Uncharacterized protein n=1 Tax=Anguilla anguilla TaxID=7936 RepID=A0A0E9VPW0_ANGAN
MCTRPLKLISCVSFPAPPPSLSNDHVQSLVARC